MFRPYPSLHSVSAGICRPKSTCCRRISLAAASITSAQRRGIATRSTRYPLNTGATIPAIGFGTFQDPDSQENAVFAALEAGYRHIDTARVYDTEKQVGKALTRTHVRREDVFLTTKIWCNSHHPDDVEGALNASLEDLRTEYVDLFLIHYPCTFRRGTDRFPKGKDGRMIMGETTYIDTWRAMETLLGTGKVKAIGVSNFSKGEVETLLREGSIVPAVHQMELHPYLQQKGFHEWHRGKGIHTTHFSSLANMNSFYQEVSWSKGHTQVPKLLEDPLLRKIGSKYDKSAAQVVLAWGISKGRSVLTKSVIPWQIRENLEGDFELATEDVAEIDAMDRKLRFNDPSEEYRWKLYSDLEGV